MPSGTASLSVRTVAQKRRDTKDLILNLTPNPAVETCPPSLLRKAPGGSFITVKTDTDGASEGMMRTGGEW